MSIKQTSRSRSLASLSKICKSERNPTLNRTTPLQNPPGILGTSDFNDLCNIIHLRIAPEQLLMEDAEVWGFIIFSDLWTRFHHCVKRVFDLFALGSLKKCRWFVWTTQATLPLHWKSKLCLNCPQWKLETSTLRSCAHGAYLHFNPLGPALSTKPLVLCEANAGYILKCWLFASAAQ